MVRGNILIRLAVIIIIFMGSLTYGIFYRMLDSTLWPYSGSIRNYANALSVGNSAIGQDCFVASGESNILNSLNVSKIDEIMASCNNNSFQSAHEDRETYTKLTTRVSCGEVVVERSFLNFRGNNPPVSDICTIAAILAGRDPGVGVITHSDYEDTN